MELKSAPIHLARKQYADATETQLQAYAIDEEHIMIAFTDSDPVWVDAQRRQAQALTHAPQS